MKYSLRNIVPLLSLAAVVLLPVESSACVSYAQPHYFNGRSPYSTVLHREMAVRRMIADLKDLIPVVPKIPDGALWETAVEQDFTEAVDRYLPKLTPEEKQELIWNYLDFTLNRYNNQMNFPKLPQELMEFTLYSAGVKEMELDGKEIPPSWKKLLELPPESRHFRTVWVYYMLGNYLKHDCSRYYQACRAAAREGFADSHGLVKASYRNEFRFTADPVRRIHVALEAQRNSPDLELLANEYKSVIPKSDAECVAMLADPLCREVLAIFGCDRKIFQQEVWKYKFRNADVMAWRAYEAGDVETAEKYLGLRTRDTLLSTYIEAKIARYHGNNELAIQKLRQWLKFVEKIDPNDRADIVAIKHVFDPWDHEPSYPLKEDVYGLLGSALVLRRDFSEAAAFFYKAGQIEADVMYIGEHLMTLSELTAFVDSIAEDLNSENEETRMNVEQIRQLTARRAFREGQFDIARKYLPNKYKGVLDLYLAFIRKGNALSEFGDERALCLYNAAKIMRWYGMELCGTQSAPDDAPLGQWGIDADFEDCPNCKYDPKTDRWTVVCKEHQRTYGYLSASSEESQDMAYYPGEKRIAPAPRNQRFHYRYRAAELARQAADLAQDEDLRALANLFGGECLRIRTPRKADFFYKRLVKQSPHSAIAKIADKLRWFPNCPALKREMNSITPCKSLDEVKTLFQAASSELQEIEPTETAETAGDVKIMVKKGIDKDYPEDEVDLVAIWQDGKKFFSLRTHHRAEIMRFDPEKDGILWGYSESLENGADFRKYLVDLKGDGDKRHLILVDWYGGNSAFGYTGYLLDAKDHFKCLGKVPVGEGYGYPAKNPHLEFSYSNEVEYFGAGGIAELTVPMRLENGKTVPVVRRCETFDLTEYSKELKWENCTDEQYLRRMVFIKLYADLASCGLLKKGPEFARQLGYEPDEIRKYQEESLKRIRECRFWQYLKAINE